jgi:site-specific DNA-methyltransferase (adenine-specific)
MPLIPDKSIDLVITSPPYDNLRDYDNPNFNFEPIATELWRIIKDGGVIVWIVGDATINGSETGTSFRQALYFKEIGFNIHDTMIYLKDSSAFPSGEKSNRYSQVFEYMFIFSKFQPKIVNLIKDKKNYSKGKGSATIRNKDGTLSKLEKFAIEEYGYRENVWKINCGYLKSTKEKFVYEHPAIFPEKLANDNILSWSNKDDIVLDPMCGSGTTCKMAKLNKRKFIGIEISQKYCEIAEKRLSQEYFDF